MIVIQMKDDIFMLAQLGAGNIQDGSGPDPKLNKRLLSNLKKIHLCKGGCKKYIECRCDCPRCGDKHKKLRRRMETLQKMQKNMESI
jgi:hypothetical protein